jgi:hypothetical protein
MRILLDENLPRKLTGHLVSHACRTVVECGWAGKKNGELLGLADPEFDVLLTLTEENHGQDTIQSCVQSDADLNIPNAADDGVPGADHAKFEKAAQDAKSGCPVSKLLNARITMEAKLEG